MTPCNVPDREVIQSDQQYQGDAAAFLGAAIETKAINGYRVNFWLRCSVGPR